MSRQKEKFTELEQRWRQLKELPNQQQRGKKFELWLKDLFQAIGLNAVGSFERQDPKAELDGAIHQDIDTFLLEAKWEQKPINGDPVIKLGSRIDSSTTNTNGLLISFSGFNENAIKHAELVRPIKQFLIDRSHLEALLKQKIDGCAWLTLLLNIASRKAKAYIPIEEILNENKIASHAHEANIKKSRELTWECKEKIRRILIGQSQNSFSLHIPPEPFVKPEVAFGQNRQRKLFMGKNPDVFHALGEEKRAIIIGTIGIGKTTLCYRYAAEKETLRKYRISLVIPLRFYTSETGVLPLICQVVETLGVEINISDLNYLIKGKRRRFSFVFDGFNEISPDDRSTFIWQIERLCALYPQHQVVVTSRPEFYNNQFKDFKEIRMLPWNEFQVKKYLKQAIESEEAINDFFAKSRLNNERQSLLSRPFFVGHLVREYKKKGELPDNRKTLLDCIVRQRLEEYKTCKRNIGLSVDVRICLSEIAFVMQKDYSMTIDERYARERILDWFNSRGGKKVLDYSGSDLWEIFLDSGFLRYDGQNISFIHEIWQDYFTAFYLERALKDGGGQVMELLSDTWWNEVFLFVFNYAPEEKVADILSKALMNNNIELIGYALSRESGAKANRSAQAIVLSLLASGSSLERNKVYSVMAKAADNPWCVRTLLDCIDEEQKLLIKDGDESIFENIPLTSDIPGYGPYKALVFERRSFNAPLPDDVLEEILEVKHRTPFARIAATQLLRGAVGILKDSRLIDILDERAKDRIDEVQNAVVDVIEWLLYHRNPDDIRKSQKYQKLVSILKFKNTYNSIRILKKMGEIDDSSWVNERIESIWKEVTIAIEQRNPEMAYRLISSRFDDIGGEPGYRVFEMLCDEDKRLLLRFTVDHVIKNMEKLEKSRKELDTINSLSLDAVDKCEGTPTATSNLSKIYLDSLVNAFDKRKRIYDMDPELLWENFYFVLDELGKVANSDDIWRFKKLLTTPPMFLNSMYYQKSDEIEIAWGAANALVRICSRESKEALTDVLMDGSKSSVIAALALVLGEYQEKWKTSVNDIISFRNSIKKMNQSDFFSIFLRLHHFHWHFNEVYEVFFGKFGIERIRLMLRDTLETDIMTALEFVEKCGILPSHEDIIKVLKDPYKAEYHEKAKQLLRTSNRDITDVS